MKGLGVCFLCWICLLAGCKDSLIDRSLIFATHTTVGLEVSVNPVETGSPATIIIGFKRSEGVLNPVYDSRGIVIQGSGDTTSIPRYLPHAYSVIAKLTGQIKGSVKTADAVAYGSQWFATGEAANLIAKNEALAATMTDNPQIAGQARKIAESRMKGFSAEHEVKLEAEELKQPLLKKYMEFANAKNTTEMKTFDTITASTMAKVGVEFKDFESFVLGNPTPEQVIAVRKALELKGYTFDSQ